MLEGPLDVCAFPGDMVTVFKQVGTKVEAVKILDSIFNVSIRTF